MIDTTRILVVSPHPDDESLAAAGLIARARRAGGQVRILFVSSGEWNPLPQRYLERRFFLDKDARQRWGDRRRHEATAALSILGIDERSVRFLGLPDNAMMSLCRDIPESIIRPFAEEIEDFEPTLIVRPSGADTHPDHRAAAMAIRTAIERAGRSIEQIVYLTHGRENGIPTAISLELTEDERQTKLRAMNCYESQLALSRSRFLKLAGGATETFYKPSVEVAPAFPFLQRIVEIVSLGKMPGLALRRVQRGFELLHFRPAAAGKGDAQRRSRHRAN